MQRAAIAALPQSSRTLTKRAYAPAGFLGASWKGLFSLVFFVDASHSCEKKKASTERKRRARGRTVEGQRAAHRVGLGVRLCSLLVLRPRLLGLLLKRLGWFRKGGVIGARRWNWRGDERQKEKKKRNDQVDETRATEAPAVPSCRRRTAPSTLQQPPSSRRRRPPSPRPQTARPEKEGETRRAGDTLRLRCPPARTLTKKA